jgi:hypothetical protein
LAWLVPIAFLFEKIRFHDTLFPVRYRIKNPLLDTFWITFPEGATAPMGIGVTAFSLEDAFALLDDFGIDLHRRVKPIKVRKGISLRDLPSWVGPNSGQLILRGLWAPCFNIGFSDEYLRSLRWARLAGELSRD